MVGDRAAKNVLGAKMIADREQLSSFLSCFRSKDLLQVAEVSLNIKASDSTFVFYYRFHQDENAMADPGKNLQKRPKHVMKLFVKFQLCNFPSRERQYLFANVLSKETLL